jgi:cystathionine gamma-synthase/methionine-gamma-lyase
MRGHGGMLSFLVAGDAAATPAVVGRLRVFSIAASLGGAESLVTQPITTTHHASTRTSALAEESRTAWSGCR